MPAFQESISHSDSGFFWKLIFQLRAGQVLEGLIPRSFLSSPSRLSHSSLTPLSSRFLLFSHRPSKRKKKMVCSRIRLPSPIRPKKKHLEDSNIYSVLSHEGNDIMEAELDFINNVNLEKNLIEEAVCKSIQFLDNKPKDCSNELIADQDMFIHDSVQNLEIEFARILDRDKEAVNAESASVAGITEVQNSNIEFIAAQI
ncbi:hypothetical protein KFK09_001871 [Dendrobium nobile]|uniref:Uncharacterized protein n=1 Tax=Dendrobium nobile TaxID=94219 RepID=A0A8T3C9H9_DENNO|nr:hypothetical protein KFK09_001871 [Dendrobium nobile]